VQIRWEKDENIKSEECKKNVCADLEWARVRFWVSAGSGATSNSVYATSLWSELCSETFVFLIANVMTWTLY